MWAPKLGAGSMPTTLNDGDVAMRSVGGEGSEWCERIIRITRGHDEEGRVDGVKDPSSIRPELNRGARSPWALDAPVQEYVWDENWLPGWPESQVASRIATKAASESSLMAVDNEAGVPVSDSTGGAVAPEA